MRIGSTGSAGRVFDDRSLHIFTTGRLAPMVEERRGTYRRPLDRRERASRVHFRDLLRRPWHYLEGRLLPELPVGLVSERPLSISDGGQEVRVDRGISRGGLLNRMSQEEASVAVLYYRMILPRVDFMLSDSVKTNMEDGLFDLRLVRYRWKSETK